MNILFLTFQGQTAGSTMSISYLAQGLQDKGHSVFIGCRPTSFFPRLLKNSSITILPMQFKKRFHLESIREIAEAVKSFQIDIVNAQSSIDRYNSIIARWLFKLPVYIIHTRRQMPCSSGFFIQNWFYTTGTHRIVAVSKGVKKGLESLGITKSKISVIYNGTPHEKYQSLDIAQVGKLKCMFNISESDFVIGCVSRRKKQKQLLQALQCITKPVKCLFIGIDKTAADQPLLKNICTTHTVHFVGTVNEQEVLTYYNLFSVNVLPSTTEGFSQALLEAMALRVPVIATNASGNNELIVHGENGYLFQDKDYRGLAECITNLRESKELGKTFSERGYQTALGLFSIKRTITGYEQLFTDCMQGNQFKSVYPLDD